MNSNSFNSDTPLNVDLSDQDGISPIVNNSADDNDSEHPVVTRKNSRMAFYIAFLALFFTAVGITVGYKHWLRIDDKAEAALDEITHIKQQLSHTANKDKVEELSANLAQTSNDAEQRFSDSLEELDQIRQQTNYSAQTVKDQIAELTLQQSEQNTRTLSTPNVLKAEVRFLLESAKTRLAMDYDKTNALLFLKKADQLLIQMASPELLPVRESLSKDITQLEQFSDVNVRALSNTITELSEKIKPLATIEKELLNGEQITLFGEVDHSSITGKVKDYINDSISIRKQTTLPRYAPNNEDKKRIDQLLQLRLESLRMMAMQRYDKQFHQQIKTLKLMLELYYSIDDARPWLVTLEQLDSENIEPSLPTISSALNKLLEQSQNQTAKKENK